MVRGAFGGAARPAQDGTGLAKAADAKIGRLCRFSGSVLVPPPALRLGIGHRHRHRLLPLGQVTALDEAAVEAQNEARLVVLLAEATIGARLKEAQDRGEVAKAGGDRGNQHTGGKIRVAENATLRSIGIPPQRAADFKRVRLTRDAGARSGPGAGVPHFAFGNDNGLRVEAATGGERIVHPPYWPRVTAMGNDCLPRISIVERDQGALAARAVRAPDHVIRAA